MPSVSQLLQEAFNPNNGVGGRYVDRIVRFEALIPEAQAEATMTAAEDTQISRKYQVLEGIETPLNYISLEGNGWPLDGSHVIPPSTSEMPGAGIGLVLPDLSNADGVYAVPQEVTFETINSYNLLALSIKFGPRPPKEFAIRYYNGTTLLDTLHVADNTKTDCVAMRGVEGVNRVVISITKSAGPYQRVRLCGFVYGLVLNYDKNNSESLHINENMDPLNARVPTNDMRLVVENFARDFNIFDPTGIYAFFRERQPLIPKIGALQSDNTWGWVPMGRYYLQRPKLSGNLTKLELKAVGLLGVLAETMYTKGVYKTASLAAFAEDVAADAGVSIAYPSGWTSIVLTAYIPSVSHAEAFRMIAQAGNALLYVNRDDVVTFAELPTESVQTISPYDYRLDNGFAPEDTDIYNTVTVPVVTLTPDTSATELAKATGAGTHYITYNPSIEHSASVDGGSIVNAVFYADNAIITITGGTVTVTGKRITKTETTITKTVAQPNERQYVYTVRGSTLIQNSNGEAVANHMLSLVAVKRKNVRVQYRGYPYLAIGDGVKYNTGTVDTGLFVVTKQSLALEGGMSGTLEGRECP